VSADVAGELVQVVELEGDPTVATAVAELWAMRQEEGVPVMSVPAASRLLERLLEVPTLDDQHGGSERMLAALAGVVPLRVVDFLVERTRREVLSWSTSDQWGYVRYDAVPFHGWPGVWEALRSVPTYPDIVRHLRDTLRSLRDDMTAPVTDLIRQVVTWDAELESAFREWLASGSPDLVRSMAPFLEGLGPTFVLEHQVFVDDLLAAAAAAGAPVATEVVAALRGSASRNMRPIEARPMMQEDAVDRRLEAEATATAATYPANSASRALYEAIASDASERLAFDRRMREHSPL